MKRRLIVAAAVLSVWACGQSAEKSAAANDADTLTRRQKDSIVSTFPIPGASGIRRAQQASDAAGAHAEQHDTMR